MVDQESVETSAVGSVLTPELQEQLDMFVLNGMNIIYEEGVTEQLVQQMQVTKNKAQAIGQTVTTIITRLEDTATQSSVPLDPTIVLVGALKIMEELFILAEGTGQVGDITEDLVKETIGTIVGTYLQDAIQVGKITKEELAALSKSIIDNPEFQDTGAETVPGDIPEEQPMPQGGM